jgi:hypothetical protein
LNPQPVLQDGHEAEHHQAKQVNNGMHKILACMLCCCKHTCICSLDEQILLNNLTLLEAGRIKPWQESAPANATQQQQKQTNAQIVAS